jgi:hypothetical protein
MMPLTDFLKKWIPRVLKSEKDDFINDARRLLEAPDNEIWVESIISHRDQRPIVGVRIGPFAFQVSVDDARKIGRDFYEVAGGAENDAFLFQTLTGGKMKLPPEVAYALINELRDWRSSRINQPAASYKPS